MDERGNLIEMPMGKPKTTKTRRRPLSKRKIRALDNYLSALEFLRRVLVEDLNPDPGSAAEIRSNSDPDRMQAELNTVNRWQELVERCGIYESDTEQIVTMAEMLGVGEFFRTFVGEMGYPQDLWKCHRRYMRVIHGQKGETERVQR